MVAFYNAGDQAIYNQGYSFIPQERFRLGDPNLSSPTTTAPVTGGINTVPINMGGGGGGIPFSGTTSDLTTDFMNTITNRQNRLNNPSSKFLGFNTMRDQQLTGADLGEYIGSNTPIPQEMTMMGKVQDFLTPQSADQIIAEGYQEPSFQPGIISAILGKVDRYGTLPRGDQAFIARNMGYTGPTVFGENASGLGKDPFGLNVRSGFGNYAEAVEKQVDRLDDYFGGEKFDKKYGAGTTLEFDEETGQFKFVGTNAAQANKMNKMNLAKYNFYKKQVEQRDADRAAAKAAEEKARQQKIAEERAAGAAANAATQRRSDGSGGGNLTRSRDQGGLGLSASQAQAVSKANAEAGMGGWGLADGGRVPYMMGGLANLVDIYD